MVYNLTIRKKYAISICVISICLVAAVIFIADHIGYKNTIILRNNLKDQFISQYEQDRQNKLKRVAANLPPLFAGALDRRDIEGMNLLTKQLKSVMNISSLQIVDLTGKVIADGGDAAPSSNVDVSKLNPPNGHSPIISNTDSETVLLFPAEINNNRIGYIQAAFSNQRMADFLRQYEAAHNREFKELDMKMSRVVMTLILVIIAASIALSIVLSKWLSGPLVELKDAAWAVYNGENPQPVHIKGSNELAEFAGIFNKMAAKIANYTDELQNSVASRTKELDDTLQTQRVTNSILRIAIENDTLQRKLQTILDLLFTIGWIGIQHKGSIFLVDDSSQYLIMAAERNLNPSSSGNCSTLPFGMCLCGRAAATGEVVFADCLNELHDIGFDGMQEHGHYCIPIKSGSKIHGVLNLYVEHGHKRNPVEEEFLTAVANSLLGIIENGLAIDAVNQSNQFVHTVLNSMNDALVVINVGNYKIAEANAVFYKEYGLRQGDVTGNTCHSVIHNDKKPCKQHRCPIAETAETGEFASAEHIHYDAEGREIYVNCSSSPIRNARGTVMQCVYMLKNITERKLLQRQLEQMAHYDALTRLPNRTLFMDRLASALEMAKREGHKAALLFIDLDGFKQVNDTFGHDSGDMLLKEVAARLLASVRKTDTVSRLGGDEFTVILSKVKDRDSIVTIAEKIITALSEPFQIKGGVCSIGASIGIETYPLSGIIEDDKKIETMLKHTDIAMYEVKKELKNNYRFYDEMTAPQN